MARRKRESVTGIPHGYSRPMIEKGVSEGMTLAEAIRRYENRPTAKQRATPEFLEDMARHCYVGEVCMSNLPPEKL